MKRQWSVIIVVFGCCYTLCLCTGAAFGGRKATRPGADRQPRADRREIIEALLERSRLLENVHFRVPQSLWIDYQRFLLGPPAGPGAAPVDCISAKGIYRLAVAKDRAVTLEAEIHLRVFRPAKLRPLGVLTAEVAWTDVRAAVNGRKPQPVALASSDRWMRYTPEAVGTHVVSARAKLDTQIAGKLSLPIPRTAQTLVAFDSPMVLHVTDPSAPQSLTGAAGKGTGGVLALKPTRRLNVTYRRPVVLTEREATYQVRGPVAWNIDAGGQDVTARLNVAILAGWTDRLEVALPAGADRVSVTGPDVREVRVALAPGAGGAATVHLRGRITGRTALTVKFALPAVRDHASALAGLGVRNGRWAGGTLVVTNSAGSSEIMPAETAGLKELALADIPRSAAGILTGRTALAYAITGRSWRAGIDVVDLGQFALRETIADLAHYEIVYRDDGSVICKGDYEIRNRNQQFLRISLPAGSQVLLARVNEKSRPMTPVGADGDEYLLPLVRSKASVIGLVSFPVEIVYVCRAAPLKAKGQAALELPRIDVPVAYAWCEAYLPETMTVSRWRGPMKRVARYSSETAIASMSYGRSELAEGYKREDRFKPVTAPPATTQPTTRPAVPETPEIKPPKGPAGKAVVLGSLSLGRNYYRTGRDRYERKDLAGAQRALEQAMRLAPKSPEADNAKRLLANIKLARGKLKLMTRGQKASGSQVLLGIQEGNRLLLGGQKQILERGFIAIRKGDRKEALTQFQAAEALSKLLIGQGEKKSEQDAVLRKARITIAGAQLEQKSQTEHSLKQIKALRDKGKFAEALKLAKRLRDEDVSNAPDTPEQQRLQKELDELAVLDAQRQAELRAGLRKAYELVRLYRQREALTVREVEQAHELLTRYDDKFGRSRKKPNAGWRVQSSKDELRRLDSRLAQLQKARARGLGQEATEEELRAELRRVQGLAKVYRQREGIAVRDLEEAREGIAAYQNKLSDLMSRKSTVPQTMTLHGTILAVKEGIASINVGSAKGIRPGMRLVVYRGNRFVGYLKIVEVEAKEAAGLMVDTVLDVRPGDKLTSESVISRTTSEARPQPRGRDSVSEGGPRLAALAAARRQGTRKYMAEGKRFLSTRDPENALISFEKALALAPDNVEAKRLRDQSRQAIELNRRSGIITATSSRRRIQKQIADQQFDKALKQGGRLADTGGTVSDFEDAAGQFRIARETLARNESLYNIEDLRRRRKVVERSVARLDAKRSAWMEKVAEQKRKQLEMAKRTRESRIRLEKMVRKTDFYAERAWALIRKGDQREARAILKHILKLDPDNARAREQMAHVDALHKRLGLVPPPDEDRDTWETDTTDLRRSEIPWWSTLKHPDDWKGFALRPKDKDEREDGESEADRETRHRLRQVIPKLDFPDVPLELVVQFLREVGGVSIYANWRALAQAGVTKKTKVSVHLVDKPLNDCLLEVLASVSGRGAWPVFVVDQGVIRITTREAMLASRAMQQRRRETIARARKAASDRDRREGPAVPWSDLPRPDKLRKSDEKKPDPDAKVRHRLAQKLPKLDFPSVPLELVVQFLREVAGVNIYVNWRVLADAGVTPASEVKVHLTDVTCETALRLILADVSGRNVGTDREVVHVLREGVIDITTIGARSRRRAAIKDDTYQAQQALVDVRRSKIPWWELLRHPSDWKELGLRRKRYAVGATSESKVDRQTRHRLSQKLPKLDFPSVPLGLVIQFMREVSGVNIYVNWRALQVASVDKSTEVNVHLVDVSLEKALRVILDDVSGAAVGSPTQVDFVVDEGIIRITTREALSHRTYTRVYDIRDMLIPTPTINMPRRIGLQGLTGRGGGGIRVDEDQPKDKSREELLNEIVDLVKETIARDTWEQEAAIRPMGGQLVVTQTAENHEALLDLIGQLREARAPQGPRRLERTYDVRHLLVTDYGGARANDLTRLARTQEDRDRGLARLVGQARKIATAANGNNTVTVDNGRLVVTGDAAGQEVVRKLVENMGLARGANVAKGRSLSLQRARDDTKRDEKDADKDRLAGDQEFRRFLDLNYAWQREAGYAQGQGQGQRGGQIDVGTISERLRQNWGQKVQVGSINIDATAGGAMSLGVRFRTGNNDVTYTTIDEAQFRTLMQMDARNRAGGGRQVTVTPNRQWQDTIVGTDALLANQWAANVTYSADAGNTIDILDNPVNLRHDDYILIDNNGYLTAVRAGQMQHWRDRAEVIEFVETPQDIDVPRAGRLVRFEKTLIRPDESLVLTGTYTREGK